MALSIFYLALFDVVIGRGSQQLLLLLLLLLLLGCSSCIDEAHYRVFLPGFVSGWLVGIDWPRGCERVRWKRPTRCDGRPPFPTPPPPPPTRPRPLGAVGQWRQRQSRNPVASIQLEFTEFWFSFVSLSSVSSLGSIVGHRQHRLYRVLPSFSFFFNSFALHFVPKWSAILLLPGFTEFRRVPSPSS